MRIAAGLRISIECALLCASKIVIVR